MKPGAGEFIARYRGALVAIPVVDEALAQRPCQRLPEGLEAELRASARSRFVESFSSAVCCSECVAGQHCEGMVLQDFCECLCGDPSGPCPGCAFDPALVVPEGMDGHSSRGQR